MNMINFLGQEEEIKVVVHTNYSHGDFRKFSPGSDAVSIKRFIRVDPGRPALLRYLAYFFFYFFSLIRSLAFRPTDIIYIESFSAPVPILLKRFFFRKARLFVHYHEYLSPAEYQQSKFLQKVHRAERSIYPLCNWISHTNDKRMAMFLQDIGRNKEELKVETMPNYPSVNWTGDHVKTKWQPGDPLRIVYIGAADTADLYFREFIDWVEAQDGECIFDIYSNQSAGRVRSYAEQRKVRFVEFKGSVPYFMLPAILVTYDVGVILYKGNTLNFKYNAPNKLFEYLAVGLDVWVSSSMDGCQPYINLQHHPMVIPLDMQDLQGIKANKIYEGKPGVFKASFFQAEEVYAKLGKALTKPDE